MHFILYKYSKERVMHYPTVFAVFFLLLVACNNNDVVLPENCTEPNVVAALGTGCNSSASELTLDLVDSAEYCDAERLRWTYDQNTCVLRLVHSRSILNCATKLDVRARINRDTIFVTEYDVRLDDLPNIVAACCLCPFDTYVEVADAPSEEIIVVLYRQLCIGAGEYRDTLVTRTPLDIDTSPSPFCNGYVILQLREADG